MAPNDFASPIVRIAARASRFAAEHALLVFRSKPISETEIKREIERQAGAR